MQDAEFHLDKTGSLFMQTLHVMCSAHAIAVNFVQLASLLLQFSGEMCSVSASLFLRYVLFTMVLFLVFHTIRTFHNGSLSCVLRKMHQLRQ